MPHTDDILPDPREEPRRRFLASLGLDGRPMVPIAGDFSARRYFRLRDADNRPAILMDDPLDGSAAAFATVDRLLAAAGASVPAIYADDSQNGLLLLEDFGDRLFSALIQQGRADERLLYETAADVLIELRRRATLDSCRAAGLPRFDPARFCEQVMMFADLYVPAVSHGEPLDPVLRNGLARAWDEVLRHACDGPQSILLRDYHAENLMWLAEREGWRRAGLLDFELAGHGPVAYDVVSLLEDARRDVSPEVAALILDRYCAAFPDLDRQDFMRSYHILGAQRHCRILARIMHVATTAGKPEKLALLPRATAQFKAKLARAELAPVAAWFAVHLDLDAATANALGGCLP